MKRITSLALCLLLCLSLACGALAADFSDVPSDAWYAPYVETVAEQGMMIGVGDGRFEPERELNQMECLTLALRLYELRRGGDGILDPAPEDWGRISLTLSDGTVYSGYGAMNAMSYGDAPNGLWRFYLYQGMMGYGSLHRALRCVVSAEEKDRIEALEDPSATVELEGVRYPGTVHCWFPNSDWVLDFAPEETDEIEAVYDTLQQAVQRSPDPANWFRDTLYNLYTLVPEAEREGFDRISDWRSGQEPATRLAFALALSAAAGDLETRNEIEAAPDCEEEAVLKLYRAGILRGMDRYGTFAGSRTLNRAEAAAMLARVLDPELRLSFTPTPAAYAEALSEYENSPWTVVERWDTPCGVVLYAEATGVPHGGVVLSLFRPDGAGVNLLETVPAKNGWNVKPWVETAELSGDGLRLSFSVRYEDAQTEPDWLAHEMGEYRYVSDLAQGSTSLLEFVPAT